MYIEDSTKEILLKGLCEMVFKDLQAHDMVIDPNKNQAIGILFQGMLITFLEYLGLDVAVARDWVKSHLEELTPYFGDALFMAQAGMLV